MVRSRDELAADVLKRLDQTGDIARVKDETSLLASSSVGRLFLRAAGVHPAKARELIQRTDDIILTAARYVEVFAPRGWAPCELTPLGAASRALTELNRTGSMEAAESILIAGWAEGKHLDFAWSRLIGLGIKDPAMGEIHRARARLIKTALKHHRQSEYAASVPIVLAQIDGLVADLTHGQHGFFHKVDRAMLSDIHTLAGLPEGLLNFSRFSAPRTIRPRPMAPVPAMAFFTAANSRMTQSATPPKPSC
jgi:hypothetical protein